MRGAISLLFILAACLTLVFAGGPAGYHPVPFPRSDAVTMPLKGHNGDGTGGICLGIIGREDLGVVDMPGFILDPVVRHRLNQRNKATVGWTNLSTDPGVIVQEYRASITNGFKLLAVQSGEAALIEASNRPLSFPELGDPEIQLDTVAKPPTTTCMKSSCYGYPPSLCIPKGCSGGCADCVGVKVPSIN